MPVHPYVGNAKNNRRYDQLTHFKAINIVQMIRERISTSTVLLLAYTGKNLRYFYVRRNAVILKCDWPRNPDWSSEFYDWLKRSSRCAEK
jgi:hypothetical protein